MKRGESARQTFQMRGVSRCVLAVIVGLIVTPIAATAASAQIAGSPDAVYQKLKDRVIPFVITADGRLVNKYWHGQKWVWQDQGAPPGTSIPTMAAQYAPSAVYQPTRDRVVVFVTGVNGHLYAKFLQGQQWSAWRDAGFPSGASGGRTSTSGAPSAVYQSTQDRVMAFVAGEDGHLYRVFWDERRGWVWTDHGMPGGPALGTPLVPVVSTPAAVFLSKQNPLPRIIAFVRGKDGNLYTLYTPDDGQNWNWGLLGIPSFPGAPSQPIMPNTESSVAYDQSLDLAIAFFFGQDRHVYDVRFQLGSWLWEDQGPLPGPTVNSPRPHAIYEASQDRLSVFATGQDGHLYVKGLQQSSGGSPTWSSWDDAGLPPGSSVTTPTSPHAVHHTLLDRVFAFVAGQNGHLYSVFYDDRQRKWVWEDQGSPPALCSAGFKCCGSPVLPNGSCDRQCVRRQFPCVAVRPR